MNPSIEQLRGNWNYPTSVRFGLGRIAELPAICHEVGLTRPLLVTDRGLAGLPMVQAAIDANEAVGLPTGLFSDVQPNPVGRNVEDGLKVYRDGGHDGVIAFGGGSPLDVGKSIAFMAAQDRSIWDFEDVGDNFKRARLEGIGPIVAVPTTAGTGSEVGRCSVITHEETHTKKIIFHPKMMPKVALLDPGLTVGMSPLVTAGTGLDALAHNLEAYCASGYHPMADGIGVEGIRLVKEYLLRAYTDGHDLVARAQMLVAATMGATAFQKGLGAVHALSHPIGTFYEKHHGLTNGVFLPYVLAFNRPVIEERITQLAAYIGLPNPSFDSFMTWILELRAALGTPHTLQDFGVDDTRFAELAKMAVVDPPVFGNPLPCTEADLVGMFRAAYEGRL